MNNFWTRPKTIIWTIVIVLLGIVIFQNVEPVTLDVLFWSTPPLPKLVFILISMLVGAILTLVIRYELRRNKKIYTPE